LAIALVTLVRQAGAEAKAANTGSPVAAELRRAEALFGRGEYRQAQLLLHEIAGAAGGSAAVAEKARFLEAECLRLRGLYPSAADAYQRAVTGFPGGAFRRQANKSLFDVANYWLDDTRAEMQACNEWNEGKRLLVLPAPFFHLDKGKPFFDEEGRALRVLKQVYRNDPTGPLAEKALWFVGSVAYYREDYRQADAHFSELIRKHPRGELTPRAIELAILCKVLLVSESGADGGRLDEARRLAETFRRDFAEARAKEEFLGRQCCAIARLEAERDLRVAGLLARAGQIGPARSRYAEVCKRHPGTAYAEQARARLEQLPPRAARP
jgi:TolA-binding protein